MPHLLAHEEVVDVGHCLLAVAEVFGQDLKIASAMLEIIRYDERNEEFGARRLTGTTIDDVYEFPAVSVYAQVVAIDLLVEISVIDHLGLHLIHEVRRMKPTSPCIEFEKHLVVGV